MGGCRCNHSCSWHTTGGAAALCPPPFLQLAPHWTSLPGSCWDGTLLGLRKPQDGVWGHRAAGTTLFGGSLLKDLRLTSLLCDIPHAGLQKSLTHHPLFHVDFLWDQQNSSCGWFKVFLKPRITLKGDSVLGWKPLSLADHEANRKILLQKRTRECDGKEDYWEPTRSHGFCPWLLRRALEQKNINHPLKEEKEKKKKKHVNSPLCLTPTKSIFPFIRTFCCIDQQHKVKTVAKCLYGVWVQRGTTRCHRVGKSLCRSPVTLTTPQCCKVLGTLHGTIKPKKGFQFLLVTAATFPGTVSHVDYKQFSLLSSCFPDQR